MVMRFPSSMLRLSGVLSSIGFCPTSDFLYLIFLTYGATRTCGFFGLFVSSITL